MTGGRARGHAVPDAGADASTDADADAIQGVDAPEGPPARRRPQVSAAGVALPALVVAAFLFAAWQRRWTVDDAYINFRVVDQFLAGNGPVYNVGERVEATTSTLWAVILVGVQVVSPFSFEWSTLVVELVLGVAGMVAAMAGALRLADLLHPPAEGGRARVVVPLGAAAYLGAAGSWDWATGGLENARGMAWLGVGFWLVVRLVGRGPVSRRRLLVTAAFVGLGVLVRPDFAPYSAGLALPVIAVAWRRGAGRNGVGRWRPLVAIAAAAAALPLVVQVFRMGYYAQLVPNPLHAKESSHSWWSQGWEYLSEFVGSSWLLVPALLTAAALAATWHTTRTSPGRRDWRLVVVGVEAGAALHVLGIVRAGGDYMHARLLLPAWFALLLPIFAVRLTALAGRWAMAGALALGAWAAVAAVTLRPSQAYDVRALTLLTTYGHPVTADDMLRTMPLGGARGLSGAPGYHLIDGHGDVTRTYRAVDGRSVVSADMLGVFGYVTPLDVWVHDKLALADPVLARVELTHRGRPGHEKVATGPWIAALFVDPAQRVPPGFMAVSPFAAESAGVDVTLDPDRFDDDRAAAAEALGCGELGELVHDTRAPLDAKRFVGNMVDAVRLHGLRFPGDPREARDALCGDG